MPPPTVLCVKTRSVKSLIKDYKDYLAEIDEQEKRIDELTKNGADEADIRYQKKLLCDTTQMIPDTKRRINHTCIELQNLLEKSENADATELESAKIALKDASNIQ